MRTTCPHCFQPADWIDTITTKCPECLTPDEIGPARLVSRQTQEGVTTHMRGRELRRKLVESRDPK